MMMFRCTNGLPSANTSGREIAAASAITPPHASPSHDENLRHGRPLVRLPQKMFAQEVGKLRAGECPQQAQDNHHSAKEEAEKKQPAHAEAFDSPDYAVQLQADQDEYQPVQNKCKCSPYRRDLHSYTCGEEFRAATAQVQPAGNQREHP